MVKTEPKKFGYARVSTGHQDLQMQIQELIKAGVPEDNIYTDKMTGAGKPTDRPQYKAFLQRLEDNPTSIAYVYNLDRISRDFTYLKEEYSRITGIFSCQLRVIKLPILEQVYSDNLTGKLINSIIIDLLAWVAETERAFTKMRQEDGIQTKRAGNSSKKKRKIGTPEITTETFKNWNEVYKDWKSEKITATDALKKLTYKTSTGDEKTISRSKFYELIRTIEGNNIEYPSEWKDKYYTDWKSGEIRSTVNDNGKRVIAYVDVKDGIKTIKEVIPIPQGKFYQLIKQYRKSG